MKKRFEVIVAGTVESKFATRAEAEARLEEVKHSFYALVHPVDCFWIRERE